MKIIPAVLILGVALLHSISGARLYDPSYEGDTWVALGNPFRIACKIPMQEPFALEWTINNEPLNVPTSGYNIIDDFLESESALVSVLSVRQAQTFHAGFYRCNKFSSHGHLIRVRNSSADETSEDVIIKPGLPYLILNCSLSTDQVVWKKNGTEIEAKEGSVEISIEESRSSLKLIKPRIAELLGLTYTCSRNDEENVMRIAMEPVVQEFSKSASVVEGDKLRQPCTVFGYPTPSVQWKKSNDGENDWEDISANGHYEFDSNEGVPEATLIINNATVEDRAFYMCYASNIHGSANSTVLVRVIDKYAAVWPFVGICVEVVVLCAVILIFESRRTKKLREDSDNEQQNNSKHVSNAKDSELRNRK